MSVTKLKIDVEKLVQEGHLQKCVKKKSLIRLSERSQPRRRNSRSLTNQMRIKMLQIRLVYLERTNK
jgi:hypothetical protein